MNKEVKKHLNVQYGKHSLVKAKNDFGQAFCPDRGYVSDKRLFELALVGVQYEIVTNIREKELYPDNHVVHLAKNELIQRLKENRVYLKEVLDSLG